MSLWEEVGGVGVQTCFAARSYYQTPPSSPSSELPVVPACKGRREEVKGEGGKEGGREERREGGRKGGREGGGISCLHSAYSTDPTSQLALHVLSSYTTQIDTQ